MPRTYRTYLQELYSQYTAQHHNFLTEIDGSLGQKEAARTLAGSAHDLSNAIEAAVPDDEPIPDVDPEELRGLANDLWLKYLS